MAVALGAPIHGEFSSADASALTEAASRLALYPASSTTALTLGSTDQVQVTAVTITTQATLTVQIYDGADNVIGAGERIGRVQNATNIAMQILFLQPHFCQLGTFPKVKTNGAGQVDVTLNGTVWTKPS